MGEIFKAYDIRGIYPSEINENIAFKLAKALAKYFNAKNCLIAGDVRKSTESLKKSLIEGLIDSNLEVHDAGIISTSTFNYLISNFKFDFGVMITASHNPPEYNGFKIYNSEGEPIGIESGLKEIKEIYEKIEAKKENGKGKLIEKFDLKNEHLKFLKEKIKKEKIREFKIAIDLGSGCANIVFPEILKEINCEILLLNSEIDGEFKSRLPEPNEENLKELIETIKKEKFDFGIAFDGDADRIVFLDEKGKLLRGDQIAYLFVKYLKPKAFVFDFSFPPRFKKILEKEKIKFKESKVGRVFISKVAKEIDADIAIEYSGHIYFKELKYNEDTFYAFIKFLQILSKEKKSLSKILEEYKTYNFISYKVKVEDTKKELVMQKLKEKFEEFNISTLDGIKVIFDDNNWFLIRPSNTEPIIRIHIEAENESKMNEIKKIIDKNINEILNIL